jgi:phloretin hydrolase
MTEFKQDLTPDEKSKAYSKYFYRAPNPPAPERITAMDKPINPSKALPIEKINNLLNAGYDDVEAGWCILANGAGYVANYVPMPGVTVDMVNWWFAWHGLEDLRYKLWWPEGHFSVSLSDDDRQKVLDPKRPVALKFQGLTHHVVEDVGGGAARIAISFLTPENVGFDLSRFKSPAVGTIVSANIHMTPLNPSPGVTGHGMSLFMLHFIREIPGGIEFRSRFWMGYNIVDKRPQLLLPRGVILEESIPWGAAMHNVYEYANLASILPQIYKEQNGTIP